MYDPVAVRVRGNKGECILWEPYATKLEAGVGTVDTVCDPGQQRKSGTLGVRGMCKDKEMYGNEHHTPVCIVSFFFYQHFQ